MNLDGFLFFTGHLYGGVGHRDWSALALAQAQDWGSLRLSGLMGGDCLLFGQVVQIVNMDKEPKGIEIGHQILGEKNGGTQVPKYKFS